MIGDFDLKFVILVVLSLLILLMSFDLVATEREDGTLRLILAQAVSFRSLQSLISIDEDVFVGGRCYLESKHDPLVKKT